MSSPQLPNYLHANRKRLALFQSEVAFLMGTRGGTKISRIEKFVRLPDLKAAIAFEVIYKRSVRELFSGLYKEVEKEVAERAKILTYRKDLKPSRRTARKREALRDLAGLIN
jgi:transcriptional regulator with XRE-family HTH domain